MILIGWAKINLSLVPYKRLEKNKVKSLLDFKEPDVLSRG